MGSKKKYYAVKAGHKPGIYETWDECKKNVDGYPGAQYKSFKTLKEAEDFLVTGYVYKERDTRTLEEVLEARAQEEKEDGSASEAVAYVDGSFNSETEEYSYGMVIYHGGNVFEDSMCFNNPDMVSLRNIAGEIEGSMHAISYCLEHGIKSVDIYYDYIGIEKWAKGEWKTNTKGTTDYKKYIDSVSGRIDIRFVKVKGHSGEKGINRADQLAKGALGIK